jgi:hypothetical protein
VRSHPSALKQTESQELTVIGIEACPNSFFRSEGFDTYIVQSAVGLEDGKYLFLGNKIWRIKNFTTLAYIKAYGALISPPFGISR